MDDINKIDGVWTYSFEAVSDANHAGSYTITITSVTVNEVTYGTT